MFLTLNFYWNKFWMDMALKSNKPREDDILSEGDSKYLWNNYFTAQVEHNRELAFKYSIYKQKVLKLKAVNELEKRR